MILLMGMPGSGKGTQGKMLADRHGYHLISMGELVRLYVTGERRQQMLAGILLDDEEIISIIDKVLSSIKDNEDCILDGFPRTIPQAEWLLEQIKSGRFELSKVFYLKASRDAVVERLSNRGRMDDNETVITERMKEYDRLTQPLIEWFGKNGITVTDINAEQSVEAVYTELNDALEALDS
jgi:adenylate kinase